MVDATPKEINLSGQPDGSKAYWQSELTGALLSGNKDRSLEVLAIWVACPEGSCVLDARAAGELVRLLCDRCDIADWGSAFMAARALDKLASFDKTLGDILASDTLDPRCSASTPRTPLERLHLATVSVVQAFNQAIPREGPAASAHNDSNTTMLQLTLTVSPLCSAMQSLAVQMAANVNSDTLLNRRGMDRALLTAAVVNFTSPWAREGADDNLADVLCFAVLKARRAAAELLANLLEDASPALRRQKEIELVASDEKAVIRLVEALVYGRPDAELHPILLELLWRGVRRVQTSQTGKQADGKDAESLMHKHIDEIAGQGVCDKLCAMKAESISDCGIGLSMQLCQHAESLLQIAGCHCSWGALHAVEIAATISPHSIMLSGQLSDPRRAESTDGANSTAIILEIPWACIDQPKKIVEQGWPLRLTVDVGVAQVLGVVPASVAVALGTRVEVAILELHCPSLQDGSEAAAQFVDGLSTKLRQVFVAGETSFKVELEKDSSSRDIGIVGASEPHGMENLSVHALHKLCDELGIPKYGSKKQLIARILVARVLPPWARRRRHRSRSLSVDRSLSVETTVDPHSPRTPSARNRSFANRGNSSEDILQSCTRGRSHSPSPHPTIKLALNEPHPTMKPAGDDLPGWNIVTNSYPWSWSSSSGWTPGEIGGAGTRWRYLGPYGMSANSRLDALQKQQNQVQDNPQDSEQGPLQVPQQCTDQNRRKRRRRVRSKSPDPSYNCLPYASLLRESFSKPKRRIRSKSPDPSYFVDTDVSFSDIASSCFLKKPATSHRQQVPHRGRKGQPRWRVYVKSPMQYLFIRPRLRKAHPGISSAGRRRSTNRSATLQKPSRGRSRSHSTARSRSIDSCMTADQQRKRGQSRTK